MAKNIYLYGPHRFKQRKIIILDELADIKLYESLARRVVNGLRPTRTFCSVHEVLGNISGNNAFAMDLWCRWGFLSMSHKCSRSLEVITDIKSRCPCVAA